MAELFNQSNSSLIITKSKQSAEDIAKFLKDNYPGHRLRKKSIIAFFELPMSRGYMTIEMLHLHHDFEFDGKNVIVPGEYKPKEQKQDVGSKTPEGKKYERF